MAADTFDPIPVTRVAGYERRTSVPMTVAALMFLAVYAVPILWPRVHENVVLVCNVLSWVLWVFFVADLGIRVYLSERRWSYVARHPLDVIAVALPMFRSLRVLRVFTAGQLLISRGRTLAVGRTMAAIVIGAGFIGFIASLAMLSAERDAPEATITSLPLALWWAIETMSTVGYGDVVPVTDEGRIIAAALMVVGISLLGAVTATVAAWFVQQTREPVEEREDEILVELRTLREESREMRRVLAELRGVPQADRGRDAEG